MQSVIFLASDSIALKSLAERFHPLYVFAVSGFLGCLNYVIYSLSPESSDAEQGTDWVRSVVSEPIL